MAIATYYLLMACVVLIPTTSGLLLPVHMYDEKRLLITGVLSLIVANVILRKDDSRQIAERATPWGKWLLLLVVGMWLCTIASPRPAMAILETSYWMTLVLSVLWVSTQIRDEKSLVLTFQLIVAGVILYQVSATIELLIRAIIGLGFDNNDIPGFANRRFLNQWQTWTLPAIGALSWIFPTTRFRTRAACFLVACVWWLPVIYMGARGTLYSIAIASLIALLIYGKKLWHWLAHQLAAAVVSIVVTTAIAVAGVTNKDWGDSGNALAIWAHTQANSGVVINSSGRHEIWREIPAKIAEHWPLGHGPMQYAMHPDLPWGHPHNLPLQILFEYGIFVGSLALGMIGLILFTHLLRERTLSRKHLEAPSHRIRVTATISILAAGIHSLVSGIHVMPYSQLMLVMFGSIALSTAKLEARPSTLNLPPPLVSLPRSLATLALLGVVVGLTVTWMDPIIPGPWTAIPEGAYLNPRFWIQGKF